MYTKLKIAFALILLISIGSLEAQAEDAGSTGFSTLKLLYGARATAMGGAGLGIPANPEAQNLNPAAILKAPDHRIGSTFLDHLVGSAGGGIHYVYPKNIYEAWAAQLTYWNSGAMDRTEISSTGELIETGETFGAYSMVASVSTARFVSPALDIGGTLKFIFDSIDSNSASAAILDIGVLHHTANPNIKVGLVLKNLGIQTSYYSEEKFKESLPFGYGAGFSMQMGERLLGALDVGKAGGEDLTLRLGAEFQLNPALAIRGGIKSNAADYQMGSFLGYTGGGSLGLGYNVRNWKVDYAVSSYGDLGITNQLSLSYLLAN